MELLNYRIYSETGTISQQKPVMIMIHGLGGGYANWVHQVKELKEKYDLVLIELPSHGRSKIKLSKMKNSYDALTEKVMELLDHLNIKKATFLGCSLGTLIVKHVALTHPEVVDKYMLMGPIGNFDLWFRVATRALIFFVPVLPTHWAVSAVARLLIPYKMFEHGRNLFLACAQRVAKKEFLCWLKLMLKFNKIQKVYQRTMQEEPDGLYMVGELDYVFIPMLKDNYERIRNMIVIKNAGHICNVDQPETVNELIINFQETGVVQETDLLEEDCKYWII